MPASKPPPCSRPARRTQQRFERGIAGSTGGDTRASRAASGSRARRASPSAATAGWQLKIARRLGVSPAPVASNGPWIVDARRAAAGARCAVIELVDAVARLSSTSATRERMRTRRRRAGGIAAASSTSSGAPSSVTSMRGGAQHLSGRRSPSRRRQPHAESRIPRRAGSCASKRTRRACRAAIPRHAPPARTARRRVANLAWVPSCDRRRRARLIFSAACDVALDQRR